MHLHQRTSRTSCDTAGPVLDSRHRANVDSYIRTLLDFLVGHFFLIRGEQRRVTELADICPIGRNSYQIKWRTQILKYKTCQFFAGLIAISLAYAFQLSSDRALQYDVFNQLCQQLGRHAGLKDPFTPYYIRKGVANAIDSPDSFCNGI